jgi:hypothetical protein
MVVALLSAVLLAVAEPVMAAADTFAARLRGNEEVPPISTGGVGFFIGTLSADETTIDYSLFYSGVSTVTQAHIHFAQAGVNGGIVLFLCTNLTPPGGVPAPPACPNTGGFNSVSGTLTAANVISVGSQGIGAAEFSEVVDAIKAGNGYANVHSDTFPGGEIRGQITH